MYLKTLEVKLVSFFLGVISLLIYCPNIESFIPDAMVGDTNLFLQSLSDGNIVAEAEIMIAPAEFRGKGLGREAVLLMLKYGEAPVVVNFILAFLY